MSSKKRAPESSSGDTKPRKRTVKTNNKALYPAEINTQYLDATFIERLIKAFEKQNDKKYQDSTGALFMANPTSCWVFPLFIQSNDFLNTLKEELLELEFYEKSNDLYKFRQSGDLKNSKLPHIVALRNLLENDCRSWLRALTGIDLNEKVDMTCSKYDSTDVLLCHDDELEERRVAFILYLVPQLWSSRNGGSLSFFNSDEHGQPSDIITSLVPVFNNFVFFEVTAKSFHQVCEVTTSQGQENGTRLSVSGWFHGPPLKRPNPYVEPPPTLTTYLNISPEILDSWINPTYLNLETQSEVQIKFQEDSEIELQDFLRKEKFEEVLAALRQTHGVKWQDRGPANKRKYDSGEESSLPDVVVECLRLFRSEPMMLLLSNLTGLRLHPMISPDSSDSEDGDTQDPGPGPASGNGSHSRKERTESDGGAADCDPKCYGELRKWRHGSYTLLHDTVQDSYNMLDSLLFFNCLGWSNQYGGYTTYVAKGEDEELLMVNPSDNSLALVYRDTESLKFVKYVNHRITEMRDACFYDMSFVYCE